MERIDRWWISLIVAGGAGVALVLCAALLGRVSAAHGHKQSRSLSPEVSILSPRPIFILGPALSNMRVAWTATNGQGPGGTEADRLYLFDARHHHLSNAVFSHYGSAGFIGGYALVGDLLAYVDTDVAPGGIFTWQVCLVNLKVRNNQCIAKSAPDEHSMLPPQIAFDGVHLLMLETINRTLMQHTSVAVLFTPRRHQVQVLRQDNNLTFSDPALAHGTALWTMQRFGLHPSSTLIAYDLVHRIIRPIRVGDVSQVAASGDLVVWKSGVSGALGHIDLYSLARKRIIASDLAHTTQATFPSIAGRLVSWTYADGSRVQIYSLGSSRIIYTVAPVPHRFYALTSTTSDAVAWLYTVSGATQRDTRGYVVVHPVR